jgi:hypothetical protein
LVFSWMELLTMDVPEVAPEETTVRLKIAQPGDVTDQIKEALETAQDDEDSDEEDIEELWQPEFRLVKRDDPEAYGFATPQYSAHKLPKDVVDASSGGEGQLREFAQQWEQAQKLAEQQRQEDSEDD